jgi:hypothetical protein
LLGVQPGPHFTSLDDGSLLADSGAASLDGLVAATVAAVAQGAAEGHALGSRLRRQVAQVNAESAWPILAGRWAESLNGL